MNGFEQRFKVRINRQLAFDQNLTYIYAKDSVTGLPPDIEPGSPPTRANFRLMLPSRMEIVRRVQAADYWENRSHVRVCRTMGSDWKRRVCGYPKPQHQALRVGIIRAGIERLNEAIHHIGRRVGKIYFFPELFSDTLPQKTQALPP